MRSFGWFVLATLFGISLVSNQVVTLLLVPLIFVYWLFGERT
jgi:hypothetical protein